MHQVHSKGDGLFDNLMKWIELFINFVRSGLPASETSSAVSLEFLLPHGGSERADVLAEVDAIVEYHRKLKAAHHVRMTKRMVRGAETEKDTDAAFVEGVMQNLQIRSVMGDVADVNAEESEEEEEDGEDGEGRGSSSDEEDGPEDAQGRPRQPPTQPGRLLVPIPPAPGKKGGRKKDRVKIEPPKLTLIPRLTPVFVEMLRAPLVAARKAAQANAPKPLR